MRFSESLNKFPPRQTPCFHPSTLHSQFQPSQVLYAQKKLQHINCVIPPSQNEGGIYLGDIICVIKPEILSTNKIQAVVSVVDQQVQFIRLIPQQIRVLHIAAQDNLEYLISKDFLKSFQFIQQARKEKRNVLIHCHAGVSRSATILCSYLIIKYKMNPEQALNQIKKARQRAKPNENFWFQLGLFYQNYILKQKKIVPEKTNNFHVMKPYHKQFFSSQGIKDHFQKPITKQQRSEVQQGKFTSLEKHQNMRFSDFQPNIGYTPTKSTSSHQHYLVKQSSRVESKQPKTPNAIKATQNPKIIPKPSKFNPKSPDTKQVISKLKEKIENCQNSSKNIGQAKKRKIFPTNKDNMRQNQGQEQQNIKPYSEWRPFNSNKKIQGEKEKQSKQSSFSINNFSSTVSEMATKLVNSIYNQQSSNYTFQ